MSVKDISDELVCKAIHQFKKTGDLWPYVLLQKWTGQPEKVCYRAMERAQRHGLIEVGVSLRCGWLSEKGLALLTKPTKLKETSNP